MFPQDGSRLRKVLITTAMVGLLQVLTGGAAHAQTDCSTQTDLPQVECEVLEEIYDTMGGSGWFLMTNWMDDQFPCSWSGVTCDGGHIVGLYIYEENLGGALPPEIGNLTFLESMGMRERGAAVPPEFYTLPNIRSLSAYNCSWIPVNTDLLSFPNLESLSLIGHFGELTKQQSASAQAGIPAFLGQITTLTSLTLSWQAYNGTIPTEIGNLINLEHLNLSSNYLVSPLPSSLQNLTNLKTLNLNANEFTGTLPPEWVFLGQLENLQLGWNHFSGSLPNGWGNLANLREFQLIYNDVFSFIPPFWDNLSTLESIDLRFNTLTGPIPSTWGSFVNLEFIGLEGNRFTGGVHANLGDGVAFSGRHLLLADNHLNGEIPASWAGGNLAELSIGNNCLTTSDLGVVALLDNLDPDWFETQCLPIFVDGFDAGSANNWDGVIPGTP